ncbi:MAG TPA: HAD family phosphatase [Acidimicrobiales bacterium]|nr:HAD family phosphatase [Acidimicrobiales bacterium]
MIEAVVFDLDGVLVDSEPVWEEVRRAVVTEHGGTWPPGAQGRLMGMSTPEWARYLAVDLGVPLAPEDVADLVIERMAARYGGGVPLLPGAVAAVDRLGGRWPLAVASSSPRRLIATALDSAGLAGAFSAVASSEEARRGKPAPDVYVLAAERLGRPAARCVAVEDSTNGLRAAEAAGMGVVALPRPAYPPDPATLARAGVVLASLDDLTGDVVAALGAPRCS